MAEVCGKYVIRMQVRLFATREHVFIVMDDSEKGFHHLNEDWEQYYNPLEK